MVSSCYWVWSSTYSRDSVNAVHSEDGVTLLGTGVLSVSGHKEPDELTRAGCTLATRPQMVKNLCQPRKGYHRTSPPDAKLVF